MKLDLVFSCTENTNKMKDTAKGKFCGQCNKEVIDFTHWEKEDIVEYLSKNKSCGIFKNDHLDKIKSQSVVHIRPRISFFNRAVTSLTILCFALIGCDNSTKNKAEGDDSKLKDERTSDCSKTVGIPIPSKIEIVEPEVKKGEVELAPKEQLKVRTPVGDTILPPPPVGQMVIGMTAGIEASFPGGEDSMLNYLSNQIQYPKGQKLHGTIYVGFVVSEKGEIQEAKIERSFDGAAVCEAEVLRVINTMPTWEPAMEDGKPILSNYVLPISFENETK